jgi:hypothetical protein
MKDKIITGTITDQESGETFDITPFHYFPCHCELSTLVKVTRVNSYHHQDNSRQISADCLALDSNGFVFKLGMEFMAGNQEEEQRILSDVAEGKILAVNGIYSVLPENEGGIAVFDPLCEPLPPQYSLKEVLEVFRVNNRYNKNRLI